MLHHRVHPLLHAVTEFTGAIWYCMSRRLDWSQDEQFVHCPGKENIMKLPLISVSILAYVLLASAWICKTVESTPIF